MKISIALTILILALAAGLGWQGHQRLASVRESHAKLVAEAAALGISTDPANPTERVLITKHAEREDKQAAAKLAAAKFIAFAKEMETLEKAGERPDEAMQKRIMEFMDLMMSLDASQLKTLIAEVRAAGDLKDETRQGLIGFSIMTLANDHPQAALALFTESADLFKDGRMGDHVVSMALGRWAKDDPIGALEWVRKNGEKFPDLVTEDAKRCRDFRSRGPRPQTRAPTHRRVETEGIQPGGPQHHRCRQNPRGTQRHPRRASRSRRHAHGSSRTGTPDEIRRLVTGGFRGQRRIPVRQPVDLQCRVFSKGTRKSFRKPALQREKPAETGQWIEWLGEKLPADKADNSIPDMVANWTQNDYRAAGTWLANAPDGPTKQAAVRSYAETVARYDPETAAQWALTLPADEKRAQTLQRIHRNGPRTMPMEPRPSPRSTESSPRVSPYPESDDPHKRNTHPLECAGCRGRIIFHGRF